MRCTFAQIGLGMDFVAGEVALCSMAIWVIGLVPGLIGNVLERRSGPGHRRAPVVLGTITSLTAMILWAICIWAYSEWDRNQGPAPFVMLLALINTVVAAGALLFPARK